MAVTVPSTLANIRTKFRRITAAPSGNQITDAEVDDYIQTFYVQDFPEHLRLETLKETYTFSTEAFVDSYAFDRNEYVSIQPPLYVDGYQSFYSQNREQFYQVWPKIQFQVNAGFGNGVIGQTFQIPQRPLLAAQQRFSPPGTSGTFDSDILFEIQTPDPTTGNFLTATTYIDDGQGFLIDSSYLTTPTAAAPTQFGVVDYLAGTFTITAGPILPTDRVLITSVPYTPGRPTSILFFDDRFVLRPVPDSAYKVSVEAWKNPIALLSTSNSPELNEWWQVIAVGAALKFFEDKGNFEDYASYTAVFEKYKLLAQRRTIVQQTNQRTATIYEQQVAPGLYNNFWNRF